MRAPEITYRFGLPVNIMGSTIQTIVRQISVADTATTVTASLTGIPKDKILILANAVLEGIPGATQGVTTMALRGRTIAAAAFTIALSTPVVVADQPIAENWSGEVWIAGAGENATTVELIGVFDAGVASNSVFMHLSGLVIPKGIVAVF